MSLEVQVIHNFGESSIFAEFEADDGVTAVFGPSGSGKTSIINAVAGLFRPDRGRVVLQGKVLLDTAAEIDVPPHRRRVGYVFQDGRLFPHLSVAANIRFGMRFASRKPDTDQLAQVVGMLGLERLLSRRPAGLSGGEKQRVALARALLMQPRILLMDEPLAALDDPRKQEILPYLERLRDTAEIPILYVSHALSEVARLADRMVVLQEGRVVSQGSTEDVLSDPAVLPFVGVREAGSILHADITAHSDDGLSRLHISCGELTLPRIQGEIGSRIRIRVLAQDILLSLEKPSGLSSRNILPVSVVGLHKGDGPGTAVQLLAGNDRLLARITAQAAVEMGLRPGLTCYAILKATAVSRADIGSDRPSPADLHL